MKSQSIPHKGRPRKLARHKQLPHLPRIDVLLLHGKSLPLVDYLVSLLRSIGIASSKMIDLPSGGMAQDAKVDHYLRDCRLPLVLVTFDEDDRGSSKARPNVYDEIARCRAMRSSDTLVLRERRDSSLVELPSNVIGRLAVIEFEKTKLHLAIPHLLTEICSRGLIVPASASATTLEAGSILNKFLDSMDGLWDLQFDVAWKRIHRRDYAAERNFAESLDKFFQCYHSVFDVLVRQKKRGDDLNEICNSSYSNAVAHAARAWEYVAEAKLGMADKEVEAMDRGRIGLKYQSLYDSASDQLRTAKRSVDPAEKMRLFKSVVDLVDELFVKLRK